MSKVKDDILELEGLVEEALPGTMFRVKVSLNESEMSILCYLAGKMKQHNIRVLEGDRVDLEVSVHDLTRGRIVYRYK